MQDFETLWKTYYSKIVLYCRNRTGCRELEAEDLCQDIMLKIYTNLDRYDSRHALSTWIYTIARNTCIDWHRKNRDHGEPHLEDNTREAGDERYAQVKWDTIPDDVSPDPETLFFMNRDLNSVQRYVRQLSAGDRELLYFRYSEQHSYRRIAEITGETRGALKVRVHRLKQKLRQWLADTDVGKEDGDVKTESAAETVL